MIFDTFSRRKIIESKQDEPDVYIYDKFPSHFRYQLCQVIEEGMGTFHVLTGNDFRIPANANDIWEIIDNICRKEIESYIIYVNSKFEDNLAQRFFNYIESVQNIDDFISAIEVACIGLTATKDDNYENRLEARNAKMKASEAIEEINARFEQQSIGYTFENKRFIRIDSKIIHRDIVKPALLLLSSPIFINANNEFSTAHRHFRHGEYRDAVTSANRSFESLLKAICDTEGWIYGNGDRVSELIASVRSNGLFVHDFDKVFDTYISMLKSGLPNIRNNAVAHGGSLKSPITTSMIARFAINMSASVIVFIGDTYVEFKKTRR